MDMMRLLRSLEEFLYELVGWLVFYPRTFWRILRHPGAIARYTRKELHQDAERQFEETISPVLMLILSVVIAHALELAAKAPLPPTDNPVRAMLLGTEQGLLLTRSVVFCTYALGAALGTLRRERAPITRDTLREPFSVQAFLVSPFLLLTSAGGIYARTHAGWQSAVGIGVFVAACLWYIAARTAAYCALFGGGVARALVSACAWFVLTTVVIVAVVMILLG